MAKIVHFGKFYAPDSGGVEAVTKSLALGAAAAGHKVTVVCFRHATGRSQEHTDGVAVIRAPLTKLVASQPLGLSYFRECLLAGRSADLVHLHAPNMLAALAALMLPKRVRLVIHWHSDVIGKGSVGAIMRPLEIALLNRADAIIATSQTYARMSSLLKRHRLKTEIIPLGISDPMSHERTSRISIDLKLQIADRPIVLAVGRLVPYKGFDVLIEAARFINKDAAVVIVGSGPLENNLSEFITNISVSESVIMAGKVDNDTLTWLLENSTVFCLTSVSKAEAFGVVLLEAMAFGLPIVASDIPGSGVPWVNKHGVSGLNVPVGEPKALADAVNAILASKQLQTKFARGGRQRFLSEFTENASVNRMLAAHERLSTNPATP